LLGPSDILTCPKCKQNVCLHHRVAEDHHCLGIRGATLSKLGNQHSSSSSLTSLSAASKPPSKTASPVRIKAAFPTPRKPSSSSTTVSVSSQDCPFCNQNFASVNVLRSHIIVNHPEPGSSPAVGQAPPRKPISTPQTSVELCPFCNQGFSSTSVLQSHIVAQHPDTNSGIPAATVPFSAPTSSSSAATTGGNQVGGRFDMGRAREVCPMCQQRFIDPVELVTHFETAHPASLDPVPLPSTQSQSECVLG
jgi:uncharacterized protein YbaR (Trm112 family)